MRELYEVFQRVLSFNIPRYVVTNGYSPMVRVHTEREAKKQASNYLKGNQRKVGRMESIRIGMKMKEGRRLEERTEAKRSNIFDF